MPVHRWGKKYKITYVRRESREGLGEDFAAQEGPGILLGSSWVVGAAFSRCGVHTPLLHQGPFWGHLTQLVELSLGCWVTEGTC